jgi:hypothetical protein
LGENLAKELGCLKMRIDIFSFQQWSVFDFGEAAFIEPHNDATKGVTRFCTPPTHLRGICPNVTPQRHKPKVTGVSAICNSPRQYPQWHIRNRHKSLAAKNVALWRFVRWVLRMTRFCSKNSGRRRGENENYKQPYEPGTSGSSIDALTRRRPVRRQDQSRWDMPMSCHSRARALPHPWGPQHRRTQGIQER